MILQDFCLFDTDLGSEEIRSFIKLVVLSVVVLIFPSKAGVGVENG